MAELSTLLETCGLDFFPLKYFLSSPSDVMRITNSAFLLNITELEEFSKFFQFPALMQGR
jgi:hypothetical protein